MASRSAPAAKPSAIDTAEPLTFSNVTQSAAYLDAAHRRAIEQRRMELVKDVQDADREFQAGGCRPVSPGELMKEILS